MLHKLLLSACVAFALTLAASAPAQVDNGQQTDPNADPRAAFRQRIADRLQQQGIDPEQLRQQLNDTRTQLQQGTFDPAQLQQQLLDRGLITQDQLTQMQSRMQQMQTQTQQSELDDLKVKLGATDEQWAILEPKIVKLIATSADINRTNTGNRGMTVMISVPAETDLSRALTELREVAQDPQSTPEQISKKLKAYREVRDKTRKEYELVEKDLSELLTIAQETIMLSLGYID